MDRRFFIKTSAAMAASTALPISAQSTMVSVADKPIPEGEPATTAISHQAGCTTQKPSILRALLLRCIPI